MERVTRRTDCRDFVMRFYIIFTILVLILVLIFLGIPYNSDINDIMYIYNLN